jgi:hypothetical protein
MDCIETHLTTLLKNEEHFIKRITACPNNCSNINKDDFKFFKSITTYKECKSIRTFNIIKKLISLQGIRTIHPVWFFIHRKNFEKDGFIFEEDIINGIKELNLIPPENFHIPHQIQIKSTLNIYYSILKNNKINKCFIDEDSEFTQTYTEFKDIYKYLFFPIVERKSKRRHIDITYDFDDIIENVNIEINEPHHKPTADKKRETEFYFNTSNRIVQYYVNKDTFASIIDKILFRLTASILNKNKYSGLVFNAFINNIINNLIIAIFFSDLKENCINKKLTWKLFLEKCKLVDINIDASFIKIFNDEIKHIEDPVEKKQELNDLFYNYTGLNYNTLLTETGYDYYLMSINSTHSVDSLAIKKMYSRYRQEYERVMTMLLTNKEEEKSMLRNYTQVQINKLNKAMEEFKNVGKTVIKRIKGHK